MGKGFMFVLSNRNNVRKHTYNYCPQELGSREFKKLNFPLPGNWTVRQRLPIFSSSNLSNR